MKKTFKVLSIDAWAEAEPNSWTWNAWYPLGSISIDLDSTDDQLIKSMIDANYIMPMDMSDPRVEVEDDQYNLVFVDKDTREPLFAIQYIE